MAPDHEIFELGAVTLQSGDTLPDAKLAYKTYGSLNARDDNVIVMPTFFTGTHVHNEGYLRAVPALDPSRHFIVSINMFGNGLSSSPSNTAPPCDGPRFPAVTLYDNVACQNRLLTRALGVTRIALVLGWSMAGCQSYQLVFCEMAGQEICAEFKERHDFNPGETIRLMPRLEALHLFDRETGQRLSD